MVLMYTTLSRVMIADELLMNTCSCCCSWTALHRMLQGGVATLLDPRDTSSNVLRRHIYSLFRDCDLLRLALPVTCSIQPSHDAEYSGAGCIQYLFRHCTVA